MTPSVNAPSIWIQGLITALLSALAVGGAMFWGLQITSMPQAGGDVRWVELPAQPAQAASWTRILGAGTAEKNLPEVPANLALVAVIARGDGGGTALLAAAGQKAQAYQIGDEVQPGRYLLQVGLRSASLGASPKGPATEVLELAVPTLPSTTAP